MANGVSGGDPLQLMLSILAGMGMTQMPKILQGMAKANMPQGGGEGASGFAGLPQGMVPPGSLPPVAPPTGPAAAQMPAGIPEFLRFALMNAQSQRQPGMVPSRVSGNVPLTAPQGT